MNEKENNATHFIINDILFASSFEELKSNLDATLSGLQKPSITETERSTVIDEVLNELTSLNLAALSYHQSANLISARVYLEAFRLQIFNNATSSFQ